MISIDEARNRLFEHIRSRTRAWPVEEVPVSESLGRILSEAVRAPVCVPRFDNSAMDGFALRSEDTPGRLRVVGEIRAGDDPPQLRERGAAIRIMTGGALPYGADAVIKKEAARETAGVVEVREPVSPGCHVRRKGEDFQEGEEAVPGGTLISVGVAGLLASMGMRSLRVAARPRVGVLVTGRELVSGKVPDSNSVLLRNALRELGADLTRTEVLDDDPSVLLQQTRLALEESDLVLVTGGVSVGDHDHTREVLGELGLQELFWRVNQKPGKPLYAGRRGDKLVIGLPGNPYAVFVGFYMYVRPVLLAMMGAAQRDLQRRALPLARAVTKSDERANWLKGRMAFARGEVRAEPLGRQDSHLLGSLAEADVIILLPEGPPECPAGMPVEVFELP